VISTKREQSFARALEFGTDPEPGLAMLEFDRGKIGAAATCIRGSTADRLPSGPTASRPSWRPR
jgi:hypothetical protein